MPTDALTMPDKEGRPQRIFAPGYGVQDQQEWMERYVAFHLRVISKEPIDILANPTYLPEAIGPGRLRDAVDAGADEADHPGGA